MMKGKQLMLTSIGSLIFGPAIFVRSLGQAANLYEIPELTEKSYSSLPPIITSIPEREWVFNWIGIVVLGLGALGAIAIITVLVVIIARRRKPPIPLQLEPLPLEPIEPVAKTPPPTEQIFCWHCGTPNPEEQQFCSNCGEQLTKPT